MTEQASLQSGVEFRQLEAVCTISRMVAHAAEDDETLDDLLGVARTVFIYDNVVLYLQQPSSSLEPLYARAVGRGRAEETDLAWGEPIANEVLRSWQPVSGQETYEEASNHRMQERYFLGLPLSVGADQLGALVFVRYGGPAYTPEQVSLAEFIAGQVALLLDRQQLTRRLSELETERRLERMQDDFVATISHELRTPLGFIKGYATTMLREDTTWDEDTRREFLAIIDEEADRLGELIDNLLDSSRLQSGTLRMEFQPIRLDTMLRDVALRARSFHEGLVIDLDLKAGGVQVVADPTRMAQVFDNLLSNAIKYAPGSLIKLSLDYNDEKAHIAVRDYGPGIDPVHLAHIFTRFYRVPNKTNAARGTGLGLFICRRIITSHGGEISAESTPGEGTSIHIYLPCTLVEAESTG